MGDRVRGLRAVRGARGRGDEPLPEPIELRPVEPEEDDPGAYEPDTYVSSEAFEEPTRTIEGATDTLLAATEDAEDEGRNEPAEAEEDPQMSHQLDTQPAQADDWLEGMSSADTLDWPERPAALRMLDNRPAERKKARNRVAHLFPRPEATEWSVKELDYSRRRAAARPRLAAPRSFPPRTRIPGSREALAARPVARASRSSARRKQIAVDLHQAAEVVHVLVEVGDARSPAGRASRASGGRCCALSRTASSR